jgi:chromosome segregation ATPase
MSVESRLALLETRVLGSIPSITAKEVGEGAGRIIGEEFDKIKFVELESRIQELLEQSSRFLGPEVKEDVIKLAAEVGALRNTNAHLEKANAHLSAIAKAKCAEVKRLDQGINALADTLAESNNDHEELEYALDIMNDIATAEIGKVKDLQQQLGACTAGRENLRKQCVKDSEKIRGLDARTKFLKRCNDNQKESERKDEEHIYLTASLHNLTLNGRAINRDAGRLHCDGRFFGRYRHFISVIVVFTKEALEGGIRIK